MGTYETRGGTAAHDPSADQDDGVTELQERVLGLLEEAGIDTETNDQIARLIAAAEQRLAGQDQIYDRNDPLYRFAT